MFGAQQAASRPSLFSLNTSATQSQPSGSLFGSTSQPSNQPSSGLFGGGSQQQRPLQPTQTSFGQTSNQPSQQQGGGPFGSSFGLNTQQQQGGGLFGQPSGQQQGSGIFGGASNQGTQQQQQQQQQQSQQGPPLHQTLRFGQGLSQDQRQDTSQLWHEGKGLSVYRSVPVQMGIVQSKWDPSQKESPLRQYLYNHVDNEDEAVLFQPAQDEDVDKWEEAVAKRPGPKWIPAMTKGFFALGKRAQLQQQWIANSNLLLQKINSSFDDQLEIHSQKVAPRIAECRRKHQVARQRTLDLAAKVQMLRNRGYVMDNAEEELREKLQKLEKEVFDPSLNGREQEIWARMLGIRERSKRLKVEMDKLAPAATGDDPTLDEQTVEAAKKALEAYDTQLRHLQKELKLVQQEFEDWEKMTTGDSNGTILTR